ncbi:peptide ABC transporter substrate-binding protein [Peribacillus frigoritolerans]|uniref:peptide ABC transporter substrate-binding protein n=1 Tax=Peribacillus frigoritolerans TaxID=450367 RepID=UPI0021632580|nr:peptide ABC transporter substrate-binding protein [Peribacillus frigoritolerans]
MNEKLFTEKQRLVMYKKQRIVELRQQGLKHREIQVKLNTELKEMGGKEVSVSYVLKYWNVLKKQL